MGCCHEGLADVCPDDLAVRPTQLFDELALPVEHLGGSARQAVLRTHVDGQQVTLRAGRHAGRAAHEALAVRGAGQGDHNSLARLPGPVDPVALAVVLQRVVDAIGDPEERELAQRAEVPRAEVVPERGVDALGGIDVPVRHAPTDRLRSHVHELDLVCPTDDCVGDRLLLLDAGDLLDDVVDRLEVLDVQRRDHGDAGVEQGLDVLPALLVPRSGDVRMRHLVDERHLGPAGEDRVDIHLLEARAPVVDGPARHDLEAGDLFGGLRSAVRLDVADDDVRASLGPAAPLAQHRERLPDTGSCAEVDA